MNVGQADTFRSLCAVIQDHSENAAVKETGIRQANKADDGSALRRIASTADTFDALTHHNNNGIHVGGLGDFNAAGSFGGGFLDAGFLFRLNLVFSTEDRGHRITFWNDIFAAFIEEQLCAAGLAVTLERHRLFGALDNLDGENAIVIAPYIKPEVEVSLYAVSVPFSCQPVRLAVVELYAPTTGRLWFPFLIMIIY